jgi:hypothetical protein
LFRFDMIKGSLKRNATPSADTPGADETPAP